MPRINLLPWREELRQKRKKEFLLGLLGAVLFGGLITYSYKLVVQAQISAQERRNDILREEIAELDEQIAEINDLEAQKSRLLARMEIIEQLQRSRPEVVRLFDELVDTLPEGVFLRSVNQEGRRIEIRGTAQSSTRVSAMMRNIEESDWLRSPGLEVIDTVDDDGPARVANFTIFAQQVSISDQDEGATQ